MNNNVVRFSEIFACEFSPSIRKYFLTTQYGKQMVQMLHSNSCQEENLKRFTHCKPSNILNDIENEIDNGFLAILKNTETVKNILISVTL